MEQVKKNRADKLQKRAERCVCKYCGGSLEVRSIVFNELIDARIELFCEHCDRIEYGVEKEIYQNAKYFVEEFAYNCFPDLDNTETTRQMSVAKVGEIMNWLVNNLGIVDENGFCVPLKMNPCMVSQCVLLSDDDLQKLEEQLTEGQNEG